MVNLRRDFAFACNFVPGAFSWTIFKMADRREKTLANAKLTPLLIGPCEHADWFTYVIKNYGGRGKKGLQEAVLGKDH